VTRKGPRDARIRELQFLAMLDRVGLVVEEFEAQDPDRIMIFHLLREGCVNDLASLEGLSDRAVQQGVGLEGRLRERLARDYDLLLSGQELGLRISHKGRVRLAELEQALKTGRDRDPTGTMISKRHLEKDLTIALVSAAPDAPVAVCMLDMNGLKQINDTVGHHTGDAAIDTYLKAIAVFLGDDAEGYRGDGGDELVVVVRGADGVAAASMMRQALRQLAKEKVEGVAYLSASCGVIATSDASTDAATLLKRVDQIQYRAKMESKKHTPRPNVIAVDDDPVVEVLPAPGEVASTSPS